MNIESEELVHQFRADWPHEAEMSTLRCLTRKLNEENEQLRAANERLTAAAVPAYSPSAPRPFVLDDQEGRHG